MTRAQHARGQVGKLARGQGEMPNFETHFNRWVFYWVGARLRRVRSLIKIVLTKAGLVEKVNTGIYRIL